MLRAEAEYRVEPYRYEAEQAFLPCFDALARHKRQVLYARNDSASGGMVVSWLGGRPENTARWDNVWSADGGTYRMTISYVPASRRGLELRVNGRSVPVGPLASTGGMATIAVPVMLRRGCNTIEIGNSYDWAGDIDKFELKKMEK